MSRNDVPCSRGPCSVGYEADTGHPRWAQRGILGKSATRRDRRGAAPCATDDRFSMPDQGVAFEILFEDAHLVVLDKPGGLVVHPARGHETGTLVHGLLARTSFGRVTVADGDASLRPGIVHRLDKGTSGVLVVAKDEPNARRAEGSVLAPRYRARVPGHRGRCRQGSDLRDVARQASPQDRLKFTTRVTTGKRAVTRVRVIEKLRIARRRWSSAAWKPVERTRSGAPLRVRRDPHSRRSALRAHVRAIPELRELARAPGATGAARGGARLRSPRRPGETAVRARAPCGFHDRRSRRFVDGRHVVAHERRVTGAHEAERDEADRSTANHNVAKRTRIIALVAVKLLDMAETAAAAPRASLR